MTKILSLSSKEKKSWPPRTNFLVSLTVCIYSCVAGWNKSLLNLSNCFLRLKFSLNTSQALRLLVVSSEQCGVDIRVFSTGTRLQYILPQHFRDISRGFIKSHHKHGSRFAWWAFGASYPDFFCIFPYHLWLSTENKLESFRSCKIYLVARSEYTE